MAVYGYKANVTDGKLTAEIRQEFQGFNIYEKRYFLDIPGSKDRFQEMTSALTTGDLVVLDTMKSLGKNSMEIVENWFELRDKRHANIVVLDMPALDTRIKGKDMPSEYVADLVMDIFSEITLDMNKIRKEKQMKGIKEAKAKGIRFGRGEITLPENFDHYADLYESHEMTLREAAAACGLTRSTFDKRVKKRALERDSHE